MPQNLTKKPWHLFLNFFCGRYRPGLRLAEGSRSVGLHYGLTDNIQLIAVYFRS